MLAITARLSDTVDAVRAVGHRGRAALLFT